MKNEDDTSPQPSPHAANNSGTRRGSFELRDPAELAGHYHPDLKSIPELAEDSPEFLAIARGVQRCGIMQPLLVDEKGRILDDHSRTLLRCARRWQMKEVPVQVRESADVHLLIIHSLAHRRQLTKSAIAYLAYPHLAPAFEIARINHLEKLRKGQCFPVVPEGTTGAKTVEELAVELGIGRTLFFEARDVHKKFEDTRKYPRVVQGGPQDGADVELTLREWYEPRILRPPIGGEHENNRPMGLGAVIAGIASDRADIKKGGPPKEDDRQLQLFSNGLDQLFVRAARLSPEALRRQVRSWFDAKDEKDLFADEDLDQIEQLAETLKTEVKQRRRAKQ